MPKEKFDFDEFAALKFDKYKKAYCKPVQLRKATAAIVMIDYVQNKKKVAMNIIAYKKYVEAMDLFKQIKADKEHKMPKVALVLMNVKKDDVSFEVRKGGLSGEILDKRATKFFADIKFNYLGSTAVVEESTDAEVSDVSTGEEAEGPVDPTRAASYDKMMAGIEKIKNSVGKIDAGKLEANLDKYRAALDSLEKAAMEDDGKITKDERKRIRALRQGVKDIEDALNKAMNTESKKLTPERREKIKGNMGKMKANLQKIKDALRQA